MNCDIEGAPKPPLFILKAMILFLRNIRVNHLNFCKFMNKYCSLCGSDKEFRLLSSHKGYDVLRCLTCGLVRIAPFPENTKLLYDDEYFLQKGYEDYEKRFYKYSDIFDEIFHERLKMINKYKTNGKVLDIGCAHGFLLNYLQGHGFECSGLDISQYAVDYAQKKFNIPIKLGDINNMNYEAKEFDVIIMLDVIEHMPDPLKTLQILNKYLKDDGILIIQTPFDIYHWELAAKTILSGKKIESVEPSAIPMHLYFFTPNTFKNLALKAGYNIRGFETGTYGKIRMKINPPIIGLNIFKLIYFKFGLRYLLTKIAEFFKISDGMNLILSKKAR